MVRKVKRRVSCLPKATYFKPREIPMCDLEIINLSVEELEAIRLCDLLQVAQDEAADQMGISRKTFWNDLQRARQKVVDALVNGKAIQISGGDYVKAGECKVEFQCHSCNHTWITPCHEKRPECCPECSSDSICRKGGDGRGKRMTHHGYHCPKHAAETPLEKEYRRKTDDKDSSTVDE